MKFSAITNGILAMALLGCLVGCSDDDDNKVIFAVNANDMGFSGEGLSLQFGTSDNANVLAEAVIGKDGQVVLEMDINQYANKTVWFCIPGVVKYFHQITPVEAANNQLTLPNKDKGSTLRTAAGSTQAGGKYIDNDWIVALYMGVNKGGNSDTPIYWATGNLIATKTNPANSGASQVHFHVATFEESCQEATAGYSVCGDKNRLVQETADGYQAIEAGEQWDLYSYGDASGVMLYYKDIDTFCKQAKQEKGNTFLFEISGNKDCDIATAQLGSAWRTPTGGFSGCNPKNEFAAFEDTSDEYKNIKPDAVEWSIDGSKYGCRYDYDIVCDGKVITTNTLYIPFTGYTHGTFAKGRGRTAFYWSSTADASFTQKPYVPNGEYTDPFNPNTTAFNYGYLQGEITWYPHPRTSGQAIRPVCE